MQPLRGCSGCILRWEISFSIIDTKVSGKQVLYDSPPLPIQLDLHNQNFEWPSLSLNIPEMSILERDAITVLINLMPVDRNSGNRGRILWFPCIVQYTSMMFHQSNTPDKPFVLTLDYNPNVCLTMLYSGKVMHDKYYGRSANFILHHLALDIKNDDLTELIFKQEAQALTCVSEVMWRDKETTRMFKSPLVYLNRASEIRSTNGKDRLYIWRMSPKNQEESFPGLKRRSERDWQKQVQDYEDLVKLGLMAPSSTPRRGVEGEGEGVVMPDHEAMSGGVACAAPPIVVVPGQTVVLKFFNLASRTDVKQGCEVHIKWNDYVRPAAPAASAAGKKWKESNSSSTAANAAGLLRKSGFKRFSLNALYKRVKQEKQQLFRSSFTVYSGFTVEIDYAHNHPDQISIVAIYVHVQDYHFTLDKLGHYHILNTN